MVLTTTDMSSLIMHLRTGEVAVGWTCGPRGPTVNRTWDRTSVTTFPLATLTSIFLIDFVSWVDPLALPIEHSQLMSFLDSCSITSLTCLLL